MIKLVFQGNTYEAPAGESIEAYRASLEENHPAVRNATAEWNADNCAVVTFIYDTETLQVVQAVPVSPSLQLASPVLPPRCHSTAVRAIADPLRAKGPTALMMKDALAQASRRAETSVASSTRVWTRSLPIAFNNACSLSALRPAATTECLVLAANRSTMARPASP
mgnify:CR=1 FL=1